MTIFTKPGKIFSNSPLKIPKMQVLTSTSHNGLNHNYHNVTPHNDLSS